MKKPTPEEDLEKLRKANALADEALVVASDNLGEVSDNLREAIKLVREINDILETIEGQ